MFCICLIINYKGTKVFASAIISTLFLHRTHVILERSEAEQNNSSLEHVQKQLNDYKVQYALEADDELWLVIDKDRWTEAISSRVAIKCAQDDYMHMALSNPGSELWYCYIWWMPHC